MIISMENDKNISDAARDVDYQAEVCLSIENNVIIHITDY